MHRRQFLAAAAIAPLVTTLNVQAGGGNIVNYTREKYEAALASGEPFILDFYAPW